MRPRLAIPALLSVALAAGGPAAFGRAGTLDRPGIALPAGVDLGGVNAALADPGFRFVEGRYVNAATDLYYGGDAADAGRFLAALAACDGAVVDVRFQTRRQASGPLVSTVDALPVDVLPADARWHVRHSGWANAERLAVTIYVGDGGLDVTEIELPEWHGRSGRDADPEKPAAE